MFPELFSRALVGSSGGDSCLSPVVPKTFWQQHVEALSQLLALHEEEVWAVRGDYDMIWQKHDEVRRNLDMAWWKLEKTMQMIVEGSLEVQGLWECLEQLEAQAEQQAEVQQGAAEVEGAWAEVERQCEEWLANKVALGH
ncbi:hypothetical protein E4T56_gene12114 [Termitomyces sp. T112]|nr:hypothetical protein E4T56_gene12114 [Termitomyces sp. T112]